MAFDLYDADGAPRITSQDKEISVTVIGRFGRQKATFPLAKWQTAYER